MLAEKNNEDGYGWLEFDFLNEEGVGSVSLKKYEKHNAHKKFFFIRLNSTHWFGDNLLATEWLDDFFFRVDGNFWDASIQKVWDF